MVALISFLLVVTLSLIVERVATVTLILTGLSHDTAQFQARSAFAGTGFTTGEAEQMVTHPARRRIILWLMGLRSVEIITGVSSLILSFVGSFVGMGSTREGVMRSLLIGAGLVALGVAASSGWVDRHLSRLIAWALRRWTTLDVRDYTTLLGLTSGYTVLEMLVDADNWMAHRRLDELDLPEEGVTVLAIQRADGGFVGAPHDASVIRPRDTLILYGRAEPLAQISGRRSVAVGDEAHRDAVRTHRQVVQDQGQRDHAWQVRWRQRYERPPRPADAPPLDAHESSSARERADGWLDNMLRAGVRQQHARAQRRTDAGAGAAGLHIGGSQSPQKGEGEGPEPSPCQHPTAKAGGLHLPREG